LPKVRHLYVARAIADLIDGSDPETRFPSVEATVVTDRYMAGHLMIVSLTEARNPPKSRPDLERLEGLDEMWVMCFRRPRPGWRLLGRFLAERHFVAVRAYDRHDLGGKMSYEAKAKAMVADWDALFPGTPPFRADTVEDYVGGVWRDVSK
jgi:hypothetical protein